MESKTKKYSNGEVTVVWQPEMCIHSKVCWKNLREVFDPFTKPWVNMKGAETARIVEQVKQCPSSALSYYMNNELEESVNIETDNVIEVSANGPLLVYGNITIKDADGNKVQRNKVTAFCRCGASSNKPYCDGSHAKVGFKD